MKMRSTAVRVAPIVRMIAMSRVFERTSMISDDAMLNAATRTMMLTTMNMTTRSRSSAENRAEFICRQSVMIARPCTSRCSGASISWTLSGLLVWIWIIPTWSPINNSCCAS